MLTPSDVNCINTDVCISVLLIRVEDDNVFVEIRGIRNKSVLFGFLVYSFNRNVTITIDREVEEYLPRIKYFIIILLKNISGGRLVHRCDECIWSREKKKIRSSDRWTRINRKHAERRKLFCADITIIQNYYTTPLFTSIVMVKMVMIIVVSHSDEKM